MGQKLLSNELVELVRKMVLENLRTPGSALRIPGPMATDQATVVVLVKIGATTGEAGRYAAHVINDHADAEATGNLAEADLGETAGVCEVWNLAELGAGAPSIAADSIYPGVIIGTKTVDELLIPVVAVCGPEEAMTQYPITGAKDYTTVVTAIHHIDITNTLTLDAGATPPTTREDFTVSSFDTGTGYRIAWNGFDIGKDVGSTAPSWAFPGARRLAFMNGSGVGQVTFAVTATDAASVKVTATTPVPTPAEVFGYAGNPDAYDQRCVWISWWGDGATNAWKLTYVGDPPAGPGVGYKPVEFQTDNTTRDGVDWTHVWARVPVPTMSEVVATMSGAPVAGDVLYFNGTNWVFNTTTTITVSTPGGGSATIRVLS